MWCSTNKWVCVFICWERWFLRLALTFNPEHLNYIVLRLFCSTVTVFGLNVLNPSLISNLTNTCFLLTVLIHFISYLSGEFVETLTQVIPGDKFPVFSCPVGEASWWPLYRDVRVEWNHSHALKRLRASLRWSCLWCSTSNF